MPTDGTRGFAAMQLGRRVLQASLLLAVALGFGVLAWKVAPILMLVFGGILFAVLLRGFSGLLVRHTPLGEGLALAAVVLSVVLLVLAAAAALAPQVVEGTQQLAAELPRAWHSLRAYLRDSAWAQSVLDWVSAGSADGLPRETVLRLAGVFSTAVGAAGGALVVFALGIYLAASPAVYMRGVLHLVPRPRQARIRQWLEALASGLRWWLLGQFGSMLAVGVLTATGLYLLGIPAALTLGMLAALLSFIPFLGPVLSAVPAILVALVYSPVLALYVAGLYLLVQTAESYLITPLIQRRAIYMPPAILLVAQLLMGVWLGFLGVLLATPLSLAVLITVQMLYVEDVLHQEVREVWRRD